MTLSVMRQIRRLGQALNPLPVAHHYTDIIPAVGRYTQVHQKVAYPVPPDAPYGSQFDQGRKTNEFHFQSGQMALSCETRHCLYTGEPVFWFVTLRQEQEGVRALWASREGTTLSAKLWQSGRLVVDRRVSSIDGAEGLLRKSKAIRFFLDHVEQVRGTAPEGPISHFQRFYGLFFGTPHIKRQLGTAEARHILSSPYFS
ncbi:MAG: hypothetical protein PHW63_07550 [Alphaproteobacteria bacterium]|nr:hypothetical protein [Alphaproteobacteria bacterium]